MGAVDGHVARYDDYDGYGKPVLLPLEENEYLACVEGGADSVYIDEATISLSRSINLRKQFIAPQAYLEIHVGRSEFERYVEKLLSGSGINHMNLTIVTEQGRVLYGNGQIPDIGERTWTRNDGKMSMVQKIFSGDLTICYNIPTAVYYQRLIAFVAASAAFSTVMILLVVLVTYRVSKSMARPIAALSNQLEQLDLSGKTPFHKVDAEIYELDLMVETVAIMKERFPKSQVHIDIPMELMSCRIPKLVLQPLCESSYKYAGQTDTEIWLRGTVTDQCWRVQVRDNGPGIRPNKIEEILTCCREVARNGKALSASIDGMGLVNIYARLALFYREDFVFEIDSRAGVTIGGRRA